MNREQARNHLAEWLDKKMWRCFGTIDREAISIAVEALSPRRREDATEEDYAYCDDCEAVEMCMWYPYDGCIFKIQSRPKGEWIGLVRCKDCRWWNGSQETMHNNHLCRNWSKFGSINTSADDYCSYGERREE